MKRILAMLMLLTLLCLVLPAGVLAEETMKLFKLVDGSWEEVTALTETWLDGGEYRLTGKLEKRHDFYFKGDTTLVLDGFEKTGEGFINIKLPNGESDRDLTIKVKGANTISSKDNYLALNIYDVDHAKIVGEGDGAALTVESEYQTALHTTGALTIENVKLNANAEVFSALAMTIKGADVTVETEQDDAVYTSDTLSVIDSTVTLTDSGKDNGSYGLGGYAGVTIENSKLTIKNYDSGIQSSDGAVTISKSEISLTCDPQSEYGIWASEGLTVSDSTINATAEGEETELLVLMDFDGCLTLSNSTITSDGLNWVVYAPYAGCKIDVTDCTINAKNGAYDVMWGGGDVTITGSSVTAENYTQGINADGSLTIQDSELSMDVDYGAFWVSEELTLVNTKAECSAVSNYAIYAPDITVDADSELTAYAQEEIAIYSYGEMNLAGKVVASSANKNAIDTACTLKPASGVAMLERKDESEGWQVIFDDCTTYGMKQFMTAQGVTVTFKVGETTKTISVPKDMDWIVPTGEKLGFENTDAPEGYYAGDTWTYNGVEYKAGEKGPKLSADATMVNVLKKNPTLTYLDANGNVIHTMTVGKDEGVYTLDYPEDMLPVGKAFDYWVEINTGEEIGPGNWFYPSESMTFSPVFYDDDYVDEDYEELTLIYLDANGKEITREEYYEGDMFWVNYYPEDMLPEGKALDYWLDSETGKKYAPDKIYFVESNMVLRPVFAECVRVDWIYPDAGVYTEIVKKGSVLYTGNYYVDSPETGEPTGWLVKDVNFFLPLETYFCADRDLELTLVCEKKPMVKITYEEADGYTHSEYVGKGRKHRLHMGYDSYNEATDQSEYFVHWVDQDGKTHLPGEEVTVNKDYTFKAEYKPHDGEPVDITILDANGKLLENLEPTAAGYQDLYYLQWYAERDGYEMVGVSDGEKTYLFDNGFPLWGLDGKEVTLKPVYKKINPVRIPGLAVDNLPQTGDTSRMMSWLTLLAMSVLGLVAIKRKA